jgi:hypothetical protein
MLLGALRNHSPLVMASDFSIGNGLQHHPAPLLFSTTATGHIALEVIRALPTVLTQPMRQLACGTS